RTAGPLGRGPAHLRGRRRERGQCLRAPAARTARRRAAPRRLGPPQKKVSMKKFVSASLLALALTAAAGQEASAHGNWNLCFGVSWSCWRDFCFPCVDPCLFGLPNGGGYGGGY